MHGSGNGGRGAASLLMAMAATFSTLFAQTPEEEYRYVSKYLTDEYHPRIEADSSVFFRAVQESEDIFAEVADYDLSFVAFARRGERSGNRRTVFDGIPVRSEYGYILRALLPESRRYAGMRHSESFIGDTGGYTELRSDFSEPLPTRSAGISVTDRGYTVGVRASVAGLLGRGWSLSAYAAGRTGRDLHVGGVFANAAEAGIKLFKHWNYDRRLTVAAMFSPSERGLRRASSAEAFTLTGDNLYNPSWGWQNGKVRNSNVRRTLLPSLLAAFDTPLAPDTKLTVAAGADIGIIRYSSLEWFDAMTPMPDNYRFLPSYYDSADIADEVADAWRRNDVRYTQIDWDELYLRNRMAGGHAVYAVGDRAERITSLNLRATAVTEVGDRLTLGYGIQVARERSRNYRQMRDLLGGDHIIDIDRYLADDASYSNMLQNDLRNPDRTIREGDRYGYDYALTELRGGVFATLDWRSDRTRLGFAAEVGESSVRRRGYYEKELFAGSASFGDSRTIRMAPYTVKASFGYSFTPRHYLEASLTAAGETPDAEDLFLQTQYNNRTTDNPRTRTVAGGEVNYTFLHEIFDLRASLFAVATFNDCEVSHYFDDLATEYCDMVVSDIDRINVGAEVAATVRISRHWNASAVLTAGYYGYASDPRVTLYADTDNRLLCDRAVAHMGGCRTGNAPQIAATADVAYSNRGWGVRLSANCAALRYAEPAAMRRTDRVSRQASLSEEMFLRFVTQERLPDAATLDCSVCKTFWLKKGYGTRPRITVSLSARNLLGSRNIVYNARESVRIRRRSLADGYVYSPFPTTYLYAMPRTLRLSVTYRF